MGSRRELERRQQHTQRALAGAGAAPEVTPASHAPARLPRMQGHSQRQRRQPRRQRLPPPAAPGRPERRHTQAGKGEQVGSRREPERQWGGSLNICNGPYGYHLPTFCCLCFFFCAPEGFTRRGRSTGSSRKEFSSGMRNSGGGRWRFAAACDTALGDAVLAGWQAGRRGGEAGTLELRRGRRGGSDTA